MSASDDEPIRPRRPQRRPRRRPRNPNPEARRRLLEAARELIWEDGVPGLRVEKVAERAGLSVGTVYLYFDGKTDLFVQLVMEYTERLSERLREVYASEGPFAQRMLRALDAYLTFVDENRLGFLYFLDVGAIETTVGRLSTWALGRHADDLRPLLEAAMERGELRQQDPELLAQAIVGLLQHMAGWWVESGERYSREEMGRFLATLTGRGLLG